MSRFAVVWCLLASSVLAVGQSAPTSDPQAISLAVKSVLALTGGASISDVTLNANIISILGSDYETGTGTFSAKGTGKSRADLNLTGWTRTDVRNVINGFPSGAWTRNGGTPTAYAQHNSWTDSAWFFPVLSSATQSSKPSFVLKYVGQGQFAGLNVQHIQIFQAPSGFSTVQRLSAMDFYLDAVSYLPVAVGFNVHSDSDMNTNILVQINFANYQQVNGVQVPFHIQKMLDGEVVLDVTVTNAVFNTGLPDSMFILQ
jgi:hypothetical protein